MRQPATQKQLPNSPRADGGADDHDLRRRAVHCANLEGGRYGGTESSAKTLRGTCGKEFQSVFYRGSVAMCLDKDSQWRSVGCFNRHAQHFGQSFNKEGGKKRHRVGNFVPLNGTTRKPTNSKG